MTINNQLFILKQGQDSKSFISEIGGRLTIINCLIPELFFIDIAKWHDVLTNYHLEITYIYSDNVNAVTINPLVSFCIPHPHGVPVFTIERDIFMGPEEYNGMTRTLSGVKFKIVNIQSTPIAYEFRISYNKAPTVKEL